MAENETTTRFRVDISELQSGIREANRQIRLANSEFQAATAGMDDWSQSADGLSANINRLESVLGSQRTVLSNLERQYRLTADEMGENSTAAQNLQIQINNQRAAIARTERDISNYEDQLENLGDTADETGKDLDDLGDNADGLGSKLGDLAKNGFAAIGAAAAGVVTAFLGAAESTREYREDIGKLQTAFETAGLPAETATETYKNFFAVLGEEDRSVEAVNHLAKLTTNQEELSKWTDICAGVWGTFGDSLPIEGLTEAANETAKVGEVTGPLADALNWAGISEDKFNEALAECNDEQERATMITDVLNGLYADAAENYKENNKAVMDAQRAQSELTDAMAAVGEVAEPIMTNLKLLGAEMLTGILPAVETLGEAFNGLLNGETDAGDKVGKAIGDIVNFAIDKITEMLPPLLNAGVSLIISIVQGITQAVPQLLSAILEILPGIISTIGEMIPQIVSSLISGLYLIINAIIENAPAILTAAVEFFTGLVDALPEIIEQLLSAIDLLISQLCSTLIEYIPELLEAAMELFNAIVDAIPEIIDSLMTYLPEIVDTIVDFIIKAVPTLLDAAVQLLMALVDAIPEIIDALNGAIPEIITAIIEALTEAAPELLEAAITLLMALIEAIPEIISMLAEAIPDIIDAIITALLDNYPLIFDASMELFVALIEAIPEIIVKLGEALVDIGKTILEFLADMWDKLKEWGHDLVYTMGDTWKEFVSIAVENAKELPGKIIEFLREVIDNVITWGTDLGKKGKEAAMELFDNVIDNVEGLPKEMLEIGKNVVEGLWNGINDMASWVGEKIKGFSDGVLDGIKDFFGIASPSKVMKKEVGENLAAGVAEGYGDGMEETKKEASKYNQDFIDSLKTDVTEGQKALAEEEKKAAEKAEKERQKAAEKAEKERQKAEEKRIKEAEKAAKKEFDALLKSLEKGKITREEFNAKYAELQKDWSKNSIDLAEYTGDKIANYEEKAAEEAAKEAEKNAKKQFDILLEQLENGEITREEFNLRYIKLQKDCSDQCIDIAEYTGDKITSYEKKQAEERLKNLKSDLNGIAKEYQSAMSGIESQMKSFQSSMTKSFIGVLNVKKDDEGNILGIDPSNEIADATKELEDYYATIEELKKRGVSDELLNQLATMSLEEGKAVAEYYASLSDAELKGLEESWKKYNDTAKKLSESLFKDEIETATNSFVTGVKDRLAEEDEEIRATGVGIVQNLVDGFDFSFPESQAELDRAVGSIGEMINTIGEETLPDATETGENLIGGLVDGLVAEIKNRKSEIKSACDEVTKTVKEAFQVHSPSRLFRNEIGQNLAKGLALGISDKAQDAITAAKNMSDGIKSSVSGINNDLNFSGSESAAGSNVSNSNSYNFVQNNYSPKALSRMEIYRQTKNQISLIKGVQNV